jgi:putative aldouronate transport system permease protein
MLNEIRRLWIKRAVQYIIIVPYFFSWVVIGGIFKMLLSPSGGIVNNALHYLFNMEPVFFFVSNTWFRWVLTSSYIWWHLGYGAVIYIATISTIDPQLYDSATVDGATHLQQVFFITLPCLKSTISIILMLTLASVLNIFNQIIVMYNPAVYETSEVLRTYAFKLGILNGDFGFATAVSLFTSVVSLFLILTLNAFSRKFLDERII